MSSGLSLRLIVLLAVLLLRFASGPSQKQEGTKEKTTQEAPNDQQKEKEKDQQKEQEETK
jgi:hypothetical protein